MKKIITTEYQCEFCRKKFKSSKDAKNCEKQCQCPHNGKLYPMYGSSMHENTTYLQCKICEREIDRVDTYCHNESAEEIIWKISKEKNPEKIKSLFEDLKGQKISGS